MTPTIHIAFIAALLSITGLFAQNSIQHLTASNQLEGQIATTTHDQGIVICGGIQLSGSTYDTFVQKKNSAGTVLWQYRYSAAMNLKAASIQELSDHGFLIEGWAGTDDKMVIRLDSTGQLRWARKIGGSGSQTAQYYAKPLETAQGDIMISGYETTAKLGMSYHNLLVLLDADGNTQWKKYYGHASDEIFFHSALEEHSNQFLLYGWVWRTTQWDAAIMRIDSSGNVLSHRHFNRLGASERETLGKMKPGPNKGFYFGGSARSSGWAYGWGYLGQLDSSLNVLWCKRYGNSSSSTGISDFYVDGNQLIAVGATSQVGNGGADGLMMRTDSVGTILWQQTYGSAGSDQFNFIDRLTPTTFLLSGTMDHLGVQMPGLAVLSENEFLCNSGSGEVSQATLSWNVNNLSLITEDANNPVDSLAITRGSINISIYEPCAPLGGIEDAFYANPTAEINANTFELYETPTEEAGIQAALISEMKLRWRILDMQGKIIVRGQHTMPEAGMYQIPLPVQHLSKSLYIIQIDDSRQVLKSWKWVKK